MKMKKYLVMLGVALVLSTLLTGCGFLFGLIFQLPGDWDMVYTWSGDTPGDVRVSFYTDGSFETEGGEYGYWTQDGLDVQFTFTGPFGADAQYRGEIEFGGETMSGTMYDPSSHINGTWYAYNVFSRSAGSRAIENQEGRSTAGSTGDAP
jgi:hypothetical protein